MKSWSGSSKIVALTDDTVGLIRFCHLSPQYFITFDAFSFETYYQNQYLHSSNKIITRPNNYFLITYFCIIMDSQINKYFLSIKTLFSINFIKLGCIVLFTAWFDYESNLHSLHSTMNQISNQWHWIELAFKANQTYYSTWFEHKCQLVLMEWTL